MIDAITFLGPALVMCLVLASIHVYLGMHILQREVIFVDLALAQLAALGAAVASVVHFEHGYVVHVIAFSFTVAGAAIFAMVRKARDIVSQEAVVGIVYAVASAGMVLVLKNSPHGGEHIKNILVGALLVTTWPQVTKVAVAYALLGAIQLAFAKRFYRMSWHPNEADAQMRYVHLWDFLFYLLFGSVITISVQVAGILLVFSFLIVPAVITRIFADRFLLRLIWGWVVAVAVSLVGLLASWVWDLPTGAALVATFGLFLLAAALLRATFLRQRG